MALAVAVAGLIICAASDLYLNLSTPDSQWSGGDFELVAWNWLPFALLAGVVAVSRVSPPAAAVGTLLMGGLVALLFWAEASDLRSSDPSSTGAIALGIGPFYDAVVIAVVCGVDAVVRQLRRR